MDVLISVSGTIYRLPLTGESINTTRPNSIIRCVGVARDSGISRRELQQARRDRVLAHVPPAPEWTTIQKLSESLPDISGATVRRILLDLRQQGRVTVMHIKSTVRGKNPRRWMRIS
jgi:hypothetical protein